MLWRRSINCCNFLVYFSINFYANYFWHRLCTLCTIGGENLRASVRRIMLKVVANSVWCKFSIKGWTGKLSLQDLSIMDVLIRNVSEYPCHFQSCSFELPVVQISILSRSMDSEVNPKFSSFITEASQLNKKSPPCSSDIEGIINSILKMAPHRLGGDKYTRVRNYAFWSRLFSVLGIIWQFAVWNVPLISKHICIQFVKMNMLLLE